MVRVVEVMDKEYPRVDKDEPLGNAITLMERMDYDRCLAFDEGKLVGIMTYRDIVFKMGSMRMRLMSSGRLRVSGFIETNLVTISDDVELKDAVELMLSKGISSLPVMRGNEVVGLLRKRSIMKLLIDSDVEAREVMSVLPVVVKMSDKMLHARQLLLSYNVPVLPVVDPDTNRVVGMIGLDEIAKAFLAFHEIVPEKHRKERIEHILVEDIMRIRAPTISPLDTVGTAVKLMLEKGTRGVVVVDNDRPIGMITPTDVVRLLK